MFNQFVLMGGIFDADWSSWKLWLVDALKAYVAGFFEWQKNALGDTLGVFANLLPADTRANVGPYLEMVQWANDWLPISELCVHVTFWYAFLGAFWVCRIIIRLSTIGVLGKS